MNLFSPFRFAPHCGGCLCVIAGVASGAGMAAPAAMSGVQRPPAEAAVRAQDDFYQHANGAWMRATPIPDDRSRISTFETLADTTHEQLRALIEASAAAAGRDPAARQIGAFYASFMDEATVNGLGLRPLQMELDRIDAITANGTATSTATADAASRRALSALFARFVRLGVDGPIFSYIAQDDRQSTRYVPRLYQAGLGLPDRDYYLKLDDAKFKDVRERYRAHLARLLALAGAADADAADAAGRILALETEIARVQWTRVETRDPVKQYNRVDTAGLPGVAPQIDWKAYFAELGINGKTPDVLVDQPSFIAGLGRLLDTVPLADWKVYARARLLSAYAPFLSQPFVDERFAFAGTVLRGTPKNLPRWERGVTVVEESLGEAVGQLYVARHFPPAHKARMEELVANLMTAYRQSIDSLAWMGPATRREAQTKLAAFSLKVGYPARWVDYSRLDVQPGDLVGNVMRARSFEWMRQTDKLGRPVDRDEWGMTPQTINAYYNPSLNEIVFPAAILQPPFFNMAADDAVNYGAIGGVIGHEISHGFDDSGSQYDEQGNLRDWWTPDDRARFAERTQVLVAQYGRYEPVPGYPLNGEQTLGENIADNAGLAIAFKAWRLSLGGKPAPVIDGLSGEQRFFYGWSQVWRSKFREARLLEQIKAGVHSPGEFRVNGTVRNQPGFYEAFDVKPGDAMYLPPEQRVTIW